MREIKFRAWATVPKSMYYDVSYNFGFKGEVLQDTIVYELNHLIELMGKVYTLMQYTGLKDKNGKEIYEGDMVCYVTDEVVEVIGGYPRTEPEGHIGTVEFSNGAFWVNGEGEFYFYSEQNFLWSELEVIGNIYEKPELLNAPHQHPQN